MASAEDPTSLRTKEFVLERLELDPGSLLDQNDHLKLENTDIITIEQVFKDFRREKVLFNGVPFIPSSDETDDSKCYTFAYSLCQYIERMIRIDPNCASYDDISLQLAPVTPTSSAKFLFDDEGVLHQLKSRDPSTPKSNNSRDNISLIDEDQLNGVTLEQKERRARAEVLASTIMRNACRTGAGSDSFFNTQRIFVTPETLLTHKSASHEGNDMGDDPIKIDVVLVPASSGATSDNDTDLNSLSSNVSQPAEVKYHLVAIAEIWNSFSVIDLSTMDEATEEGVGNNIVPWLEIDTIIVDETNLRTKERSRRMNVIVYHPKRRKYLYPLHIEENHFKTALWEYFGESDVANVGVSFRPENDGDLERKLSKSERPRSTDHVRERNCGDVKVIDIHINNDNNNNNNNNNNISNSSNNSRRPGMLQRLSDSIVRSFSWTSATNNSEATSQNSLATIYESES